MSRVLRYLERLLEPKVLSWLAVVAGLVLLAGIFNILYTIAHDPTAYVTIHQRLGPVPGESYQNFMELFTVLLGYGVITLGLYILRSSVSTYRVKSYTAIIGILLMILGAVLVAALWIAKRG